tara:strand:- start:4048 stop:4284 length:237 start_codon:yes stop_codon:yes gene_type:complete
MKLSKDDISRARAKTAHAHTGKRGTSRWDESAARARVEYDDTDHTRAVVSFGSAKVEVYIGGGLRSYALIEDGRKPSK